MDRKKAVATLLLIINHYRIPFELPSDKYISLMDFCF